MVEKLDIASVGHDPKRNVGGHVGRDQQTVGGSECRDG